MASLQQGSQKIIGIIGGGIAGPAFALQILSHSQLSALYRPIIFEQSQDPYSISSTEGQHNGGAAIGMSPNGLFPLYQLGLQPQIEEASYNIEGLALWRVYHAGDDPVERAVEAAKTVKPKLLSRSENISWDADLQTNIRYMARADLVKILNDQVSKLGGQIRWSKKLERLETLPAGRTKAVFNDDAHFEFDVVIGADGGWSKVRKHILRAKYDEKTADAKWLPESFSASNIYGISSLKDCALPADQIPKNALDDTHACWLDRGHLSTSPLPGGRIRWDLQLPEQDQAPMPRLRLLRHPLPFNQKEMEHGFPESFLAFIRNLGPWSSYANMPESGTRPLRQKAWEADEIQHGNVVLIGDAARLLLPSSGQGSSFAIEDATVLANSLLKYPLAELDPNVKQRALEEYAKARVNRSKQMATTAWYAGEFGLGRRRYWRLLRDFTSGLVGGSSNTKKKDVKSWSCGDRFKIGE